MIDIIGRNQETLSRNCVHFTQMALIKGKVNKI